MTKTLKFCPGCGILQPEEVPASCENCGIALETGDCYEGQFEESDARGLREANEP